MPIMAMTTSSSTSVNAIRGDRPNARKANSRGREMHPAIVGSFIANGFPNIQNSGASGLHQPTLPIGYSRPDEDPIKNRRGIDRTTTQLAVFYTIKVKVAHRRDEFSRISFGISCVKGSGG